MTTLIQSIFAIGVILLDDIYHSRLHTIAEGLYENGYGRENYYPLRILKNANEG